LRISYGFGVFDQLRARDTYNSPLSEFKKRTTDALDLLRSVNETEPTPEAQATDFVHRLDERHQELKDGLLNAVTLGAAEAPATLVKAYNLAVQYRVAAGPISTNAVFATSAGDQDRRKETRKCFNCGKAGHLKRDCRQPRKQREPEMESETANLAFSDSGVIMTTGAKRVIWRAYSSGPGRMELGSLWASVQVPLWCILRAWVVQWRSIFGAFVPSAPPSS
jgi:hypothetical protein